MKKNFFLILIWIFSQSIVFSEEIFLSLKKNKVNVRYGPGFEYPIKYIYKKINLTTNEYTLSDKDVSVKFIIEKYNTGKIDYFFQCATDLDEFFIKKDIGLFLENIK